MNLRTQPDWWYEERYRGHWPSKFRCILLGHLWTDCWNLENYVGPFAAYCDHCKEHRMVMPITGRRHPNFDV